MTFANDQWQEAIVQLANNGITVAPASDVQASGTIAGTTAVTVTFGTGVASWTVDISGTIGAGSVLQFEYLINSTWFSAFGVVVGSNADVAVSSVTLASAAVSYQGNAAGFQQFRVRCSSYNGTDSLTVKIVGSVATDGGFVSKSLPPGSNLIGGVNVQQIGGQATAMAGSDAQTAANVPLEATGVYNGTTVDRMRGDVTFGGVGITEDVIRYLVMQAKAFRVTTGQIATGGANAFIGIQGVANNLSVNVLIYNILVSCNASTSDVRLYQNAASISTDAGLTANILTSILNQKVGGAASALSVLNTSPAATTQAAPANAGTQTSGQAVVGNSTLNMLSNGSLLWLPKSVQNTFAVYALEGTSGNKISITLEWVEF